jgi:hypothetical protein
MVPNTIRLALQAGIVNANPRRQTKPTVDRNFIYIPSLEVGYGRILPLI